VTTLNQELYEALVAAGAPNDLAKRAAASVLSQLLSELATQAELKEDHGKDSQNKHTDLRPMPCLLISSLVNARKQEVEVCCFNSL
jgi:hypothetical protein